MKEVLISVIIPVYGVEKYIAQCFKSFINDVNKDRNAKTAMNSYRIYCM